MLFIVAGVPAAHYSTFQKSGATIVGTGHSFVASPLHPNSAGEYLLAPNYADKLLAELQKRLAVNENALDTGMGLLYLCNPGDDPIRFVRHFYPYCICHWVEMPLPVATTGALGPIIANKIVKTLARAVPPLVQAVAAMKKEFSARFKRTPLLLPIRNFDSAHLERNVDQLFFNLSREMERPAAITQACADFERQHPFTKIPNKKKRCFLNSANIQFRPPGRGMHARPHLGAAEHNIRCYLSGRLRLGAPFQDTFHYDCMRARGALSGRFPNCHGMVGNYTGKPHLNIAPSDFIRGK